MKPDKYSKSKTNTETLEQQKSNSWTPVGRTIDRASSPNKLNWKFLGRSLLQVWDPTRRRASKDATKLLTVIGLTTKHNEWLFF